MLIVIPICSSKIKSISKRRRSTRVRVAIQGGRTVKLGFGNFLAELGKDE